MSVAICDVHSEVHAILLIFNDDVVIFSLYFIGYFELSPAVFHFIFALQEIFLSINKINEHYQLNFYGANEKKIARCATMAGSDIHLLTTCSFFSWTV